LANPAWISRREERKKGRGAKNLNAANFITCVALSSVLLPDAEIGLNHKRQTQKNYEVKFIRVEVANIL
jgi:hypothetical protein